MKGAELLLERLCSDEAWKNFDQVMKIIQRMMEEYGSSLWWLWMKFAVAEVSVGDGSECRKRWWQDDDEYSMVLFSVNSGG